MSLLLAKGAVCACIQQGGEGVCELHATRIARGSNAN